VLQGLALQTLWPLPLLLAQMKRLAQALPPVSFLLVGWTPALAVWLLLMAQSCCACASCCLLLHGLPAAAGCRCWGWLVLVDWGSCCHCGAAVQAHCAALVPSLHCRHHWQAGRSLWLSAAQHNHHQLVLQRAQQPRRLQVLRSCPVAPAAAVLGHWLAAALAAAPAPAFAPAGLHYLLVLQALLRARRVPTCCAERVRSSQMQHVRLAVVND